MSEFEVDAHSTKKAFELLSTYRKLLNQNETIKQEYSKFHDNYDFTEIHYTLIDNVNDSDEELNMLYDLLSIYKIPIFIAVLLASLGSVLAIL